MQVWGQMNYIGLANLILTLLVILGGALMKFNDLKHLAQGLLRLETKVDKVCEKVEKDAERIATLEGKLL